jgi:hypothetical protein
MKNEISEGQPVYPDYCSNCVHIKVCKHVDTLKTILTGRNPNLELETFFRQFNVDFSTAVMQMFFELWKNCKK